MYKFKIFLAEEGPSLIELYSLDKMRFLDENFNIFPVQHTAYQSNKMIKHQNYKTKTKYKNYILGQQIYLLTVQPIAYQNYKI